MDLGAAARWRPPAEWLQMTVVDSHAGGEPFRLVVEGLPDVPGATMTEKRAFAAAELDWARRFLMLEPRGHDDMYGGLLGSPVSEDADISVLFMHNEGFSTMCGHGVIALTKVVFDTGVLDPGATGGLLAIDTPAGQVKARSLPGEDGRVGAVSFDNVPSFVAGTDLGVPGDGSEVRYDLAFGGAYYAFVEADQAGVDMADVPGMVETGRRIKAAISETETVEHPEDPDLSFLYGVIFTGPPHGPDNHSRHVCVFADGEVDRSPTGTGVSARLALLHARGEVGLGERLHFESVLGTVFAGEVASETRVGDAAAIIPTVFGSASIVGTSLFFVDPQDPFGTGFRI